MTPFVTVIVLVYKVEAFFEQCVESLFKQTLQNIEYIFVNDCTPDGSIKILHDMMRKYPHRSSQVQIVEHERNRGVASARNTGLDLAHGDYIIYCDGDDWVELNMYEEMYQQAVIGHFDIVWCDFILNYPDGRVIMEPQAVTPKCNLPIKDLLSGKVHGGGCNKLVYAGLYKRNHIKFPDGCDMAEDLVVTIQLFYYAQRIKYLDVPFYHYRQHQYSLSRHCDYDKSRKRIVGQLSNAQRIISFLKEKYLIEKCMPEIQYFKLFSKLELLLDSRTLEQWRNTFSDANKYVWSCPKLTIKSRILQFSLTYRCFWVYNLKKFIS